MLQQQTNKPRGISLNKNAVNILGAQPTVESNLFNKPNQIHQQQQPLKPTFNLPTKQLLKSLQPTKPTDENHVPHQSPNEPLPPKLRFFGRESPNKQRDSIVSRIPRLLSAKESSKDVIKPSLKDIRSTIKEDDDEDDEEIEDIDKSTSRDAIYLVCDIAKDIYNYMYELEEAQSIKRDYLKEQKILTPKVRGRLINWCIEIHSQLKLLPETLYMTVAVIDRYFDQVTVKKQREVQLVAVGATLIASKYEEIYPPDVGDLLHLTRNEYTRDEIMRQEIAILRQLDFDLGRPIPLAFLRRFSKAAHCDLKMHSIAKFFMELSLPEYECSHWKPSMLAAASLYATIHLTDQSGNNFLRSTSPRDRWNKSLVHYSHYTRDQLKEPASILCKILKRAMDSPQSHASVKKNSPQLDRWPELKSPRVDKLIKLGQL